MNAVKTWKTTAT